MQCDVSTAILLLSAWIRYAGTAESLPRGGAYALIIIGQVRMVPQTTLPSLCLTPSLGTFCCLATSIPDFSTKIFRTVVRSERPHNRDDDHLDW